MEIMLEEENDDLSFYNCFFCVAGRITGWVYGQEGVERGDNK
jgi:hypothetical protein